MDHTDENYVRQLRDAVYDHRIADASWELIKRNWMTPENVQWLKDHQPKRK